LAQVSVAVSKDGVVVAPPVASAPQVKSTAPVECSEVCGSAWHSAQAMGEARRLVFTR
jgi:hypothetical protein